MENKISPEITENTVRQLSDAKSFERGKDYFRAGSIVEPVLMGSKLQARCHGSEREPYHVSVVLGKKGVESYACSCPRGGFCKHLVALLLNYVFRPNSIQVLAPLETTLETFNKDELAALVAEMIEQEPDLMQKVELASARRSGKVDAGAYRRMASRAWTHDSAHSIERGLNALSEMAERLAKTGGWIPAGTAYRIFLDEAIAHYGEEMMGIDEEGDIALLVDEFAEGLGRCLRKGRPDEKTRRAWLETLLAAMLAELNLGIDLAPSAEEIMLKNASSEEWQWIEKRVLSEMDGLDGYKREALEEFLANRRKSRKDAKP